MGKKIKAVIPHTLGDVADRGNLAGLYVLRFEGALGSTDYIVEGDELAGGVAAKVDRVLAWPSEAAAKAACASISEHLKTTNQLGEGDVLGWQEATANFGLKFEVDDSLDGKPVLCINPVTKDRATHANLAAYKKDRVAKLKKLVKNNAKHVRQLEQNYKQEMKGHQADFNEATKATVNMRKDDLKELAAELTRFQRELVSLGAAKKPAAKKKAKTGKRKAKKKAKRAPKRAKIAAVRRNYALAAAARKRKKKGK